MMYSKKGEFPLFYLMGERIINFVHEQKYLAEPKYNYMQLKRKAHKNIYPSVAPI